MFELILALVIAKPMVVNQITLNGILMSTTVMQTSMVMKVGPFTSLEVCQKKVDGMPETIEQGKMSLIIKSKTCQPVEQPTS